MVQEVAIDRYLDQQRLRCLTHRQAGRRMCQHQRRSHFLAILRRAVQQVKPANHLAR